MTRTVSFACIRCIFMPEWIMETKSDIFGCRIIVSGQAMGTTN